ncbi:MAG: hypothetical protein HY816_23220 [Candidatus Wallbacteria bacterium]|nr:hypothetical protein [Candidatus Wallbacteria bacterium]
MPQATRKKFDENPHFMIEKDVIAGKVVRFVVTCKKCKKQRLLAGQPARVNITCCDRSIAFEPAQGKLPAPETTEVVMPPPSAEGGK